MMYTQLSCLKQLRKWNQKPLVGAVKKLAMMEGRDTIDEARMIGMTPDILTLIGIKVFCPPYILRPTTRLAY